MTHQDEIYKVFLSSSDTPKWYKRYEDGIYTYGYENMRNKVRKALIENDEYLGKAIHK